MTNGSTPPTHRVVVHSHEYGFRVFPGALVLAAGSPALVRLSNVTRKSLTINLGSVPAEPRSFTLDPLGGKQAYLDVSVSTAEVGDFPYTVTVIGADVQAAGGSGPRMIVTP
jgi:hypothetical protein